MMQLALHEFCFRPSDNLSVQSDLRPETVHRWPRGKDPCEDLQGNFARNGLQEANVKVPRDRLNFLEKQAVRHGRIQQRSNDASVEHPGISLEFRGRLKPCCDRTFSRGLKCQLEGSWVQAPADHAPGVAIAGADGGRDFNGHIRSPPIAGSQPGTSSPGFPASRPGRQ